MGGDIIFRSYSIISFYNIVQNKKGIIFMATLPTIESILLEINQSFGGMSFSTDKKRKFSTRRMQEKTYNKMFSDILKNIYSKLKLDDNAKLAISKNLDDTITFNKLIELKTYTGNATKQQVIWLWLIYIGTPSIAQYMAYWNIDDITDKGMSGGKFWYLPEILERNNKKILHLPVAQIVDWLLDLLGISMQEFVTEYRDKADPDDKRTDTLIRTLYNWKVSENVPQPSKIEEFFPDSLNNLEFKGCFIIQDDLSHTEQFSLALQFVKQKFNSLNTEQIAEVLSHEIPISQVEILKNILSKNSDIEMEKRFMELLAIRYAKPVPKIIRHYFLMARIAQDCYIRLLKFLFPKLDKLCPDPSKNKLLQLIFLYQYVYNLSIEAYKNSDSFKKEEIYFQKKLIPCTVKKLIALRFVGGESGYLEVSKILNKKFLNFNPQDELEDIYPYSEDSQFSLNLKFFNEIQNDIEKENSVEKLLKLFPFSTPQELALLIKNETRFEVIYQFLCTAHLQPQQRLIVIEKLSKLAKSSNEKMEVVLMKLHYYLDNDPIQPNDVFLQVENLLNEAEKNDNYLAWKAIILKYKAKHMLSQNDFIQAKKFFREALNYCSKYNYGDMRSEFARDLLAIEVAKNKFIPQNHYRYYQEMVNYGMAELILITPEACAKECTEYFWNTLYKPYANTTDKK